MNFSAIKDLKIDLDIVEGHFVTAVIQVADERNVDPTDISLIICITKGTGVFNKNKEVMRAIITSNSGAFEDEVVKISHLTKVDMTGAISKAMKEILLGEINLHNTSLSFEDSDPFKRESAKNYPHPIDKKLELWIQVDKDDNLVMNMIYINTRLRSYSIKEEFGDVNNVKIGEVVNEDEISDAQAEIQRTD
jgi:hypothetical protein